MSRLPWMPLYIQDFIMDTRDLGADEIGVYLLMLMLAWQRQDAGLPNDMVFLKRSLRQCIGNFHGRTFNRIVPKLLARYFQLGPDGLFHNPRLTLERQIVGKRSEKSQQNANKRWSVVKEIKALSDAIAYAKTMPFTLTKKDKKESGEEGSLEAALSKLGDAVKANGKHEQ